MDEGSHCLHPSLAKKKPLSCWCSLSEGAGQSHDFALFKHLNVSKCDEGFGGDSFTLDGMLEANSFERASDDLLVVREGVFSG